MKKVNNIVDSLNPTGIAIIGASSSTQKRGYQLVKTLVDAKRSGDYAGNIYPINPKLDTLLDVRCFADVSLLPTTPELVIICTPAHSVPSIIHHCGSAGIAMAVVLASGFSETGEAGAALEQEIIEAIYETGIRVLGPNVSGLFLEQGKLNLVGFQRVRAGSTTVMSQSGNVALELVTQAEKEQQFGFNQYFGIGNQLDIEFGDLLDCLQSDTATESVVAYLEGFKNARRFLSSAHQFTQQKPLIVFKAGRSEASQEAAKSHTGAMAGNYRVTRDLLKSVGVTLVDRIDDLLPVANTLSNQTIKPSGRVLVLTDGGGHGTIAADALDDLCITLAQLSDQEKTELARQFPGLSIGNPIDLAGIADQSPGLFAELINVLLSSKNVDGLIWVGLFGGYHIRFDANLHSEELEAVKAIAKIREKHNKPVLLHSVYRVQDSDILRYWVEQNLTLFSSIEGAARVVKTLVERSRYLQYAKTSFMGVSLMPHIESRSSGLLSEHEARLKLIESKIPLDTHHCVSSMDELDQLGDIFNGPQKYAMKILSEDIAHKSDAGGVVLNVQDLDGAKHAFSTIMNNCRKANPSANLDGMIISPMSPSGAEYVIGYQRDPQFGPVIMFGLGGIFVELFQDVQFKALPLSERGAHDMINQLQHQVFVSGFRHLPALNIEKITSMLLAVSDFVMANEHIKSMDLNPVIAHEKGITAVDVRVEVYSQ